jgi:ABC-type transport system involved in cytochrome bd biosynthesis fused ATPase/permease subunit
VFLALLRDTFTAAVVNSASASSNSSNGSISNNNSSSSLSVHLAQAAAALRYSATANPAWLAKALQLHDVLAARHAVAVVGTAGCGKTGMLTCLQGALSSANGAPHRRVTINPKVRD